MLFQTISEPRRSDDSCALNAPLGTLTKHLKVRLSRGMLRLPRAKHLGPSSERIDDCQTCDAPSGLKILR